MADAAVKEPSMEDILSSIRQIIAEEGHVSEAAEKVSEELSPVRQSEEAPRSFGEETFNQEVAQIQMEPPSEASVSAQEQQHQDIQSVASVSETMQSAPVERDNVERVEMEHATKAPEAPFVAPTSHSDAYQGENRRTPIPEQSIAPAPAEQAPASVAEVSTFKGALMSPSADSAVSSAFERLKRSTQDDLDAKTEALLRPMLREWLDDNLPTMVERLIREEIERVARGV